jgi:hypothetical protein
VTGNKLASAFTDGTTLFVPVLRADKAPRILPLY